MCEVLNPDATPHVSNGRATIEDDDNDFWFGFEQEYFLWNPETNKPLGFPAGGYPAPQGPYYCSVGATNAFGRDIVEEHLDACLEAGINVEGINAEVATGQWEFQIFAKGAKAAGDQVWVARYLLERIGEKYGVAINWHCKPLGQPIGMDRVCMPISPMTCFVRVVPKMCMIQFVKPSLLTSTNTSRCTEPTIIYV